MQRTSVVLEPTNNTRVRYEDRKGRAKLRSWPSGSIKRKKRSPHSASWGAWVAPRPLVAATGAGAEMRQSLGTAVEGRAHRY